MNRESDPKGSEYMHWAKTRSSARFNLATSGLANLKLRELEIKLEELEITGDGGYGYAPLKEGLAARLDVTADSIVTAEGASFANHLAMAALIERGDEVLMESPTYEPLLSLARYLGAEVRRFVRSFADGFQIVSAEIERSITSRTRLIVITNLHNPSSVLTNVQTLKQLRDLARNVKARILVDEVYLEALFDKRPRTAFHLGPEFVVTSSLTKAFGLSGLRCGWIIAEPDLAQKMWLLNDLFAATPVHAGERMSLAALPQLPGLAKRPEALLEKNRNIVNKFLNEREDLEAVRPEFGTTIFPRLKKGTADNLCKVLSERYETSVVPGRFFEMPAHFRIGLAGDSETLSQGLQRLGAALDDLKAGI